MAFSKRKPRRTPLQRLSDQRRSLALGGLAIGAVFSAAVFRRRWHKGELESGPPAMVRAEEPTAAVQPDAPVAAARPEAEPPVAQPDSGPPASEPEIEDRPEAAINAPEPAEAASASVLEPATGELSAEEASILSVLAQSGRSDDDRTAIAVATSLERDTGDVTGVLRKLGAEGVVSGELRTSSGEEIWAVTERGVRRLGAQS